MSDAAKDERGRPRSASPVPDILFSLTLDLILKVAAAITILAWASLLGQVLLRIPARQVILSYFEPVSILAVSITFLGFLLGNKHFHQGTARLQEASEGVTSRTLPVGPPTHILVPGGKEGPSAVQPKSTKGSKPHHSRVWFLSDTLAFERGANTASVGNQRFSLPIGARDLGRVFVPPTQLAVRIDAFSFNCQECNAGVVLPWASVKERLEKGQLSINCPGCHSQYASVYKLARGCTLSVTFYEAAD